MKKSILYTRTGDRGATSLVGGQRTNKDDIRLEAYGTLDELNACIGLCHADAPEPDIASTLLWIQHRLFDLGAYLACPPNGDFQLTPGVDETSIHRLETAIDTIDSSLPWLNNFVLPSGTRAAAQAHLARTICRRAERRIVTLSGTAPVSPIALQFINRLSDYLFALARFNNISAGCDEIFWQKDC